jgi:hypothetical protein
MLIVRTLRLLGFPRQARQPEASPRLGGVDWPARDWKFATSGGPITISAGKASYQLPPIDIEK